MEPPRAARWELVVVDNGSADATAATVAAFAGRLPIRYVAEPEPGLSIARNRGIKEARGRYICWTDDDVRLDRGWLAAYLDAFLRHPDAALFGGPIIPELEPPARPLFQRCKDHPPLSGVFAKRDFGSRILPLGFEGGVLPWGANFAVRSEEQRHHPYNPALGTAPGRDRLGEEIDMIYRLLKAGASGWWVPDARAMHMIGCERQRLAYVFAYYRRWGETLGYLQHRLPGDNAVDAVDPPRIARMGALALGARLLWGAAGAAAALITARPCECLLHLADFATTLGMIHYRRAVRHEG